MNPPRLITALLVLPCAAAIYGVVAQHRQLNGLYAQEKGVLAQLASDPGESPGATEPQQQPAFAPADPELLRLRNEVTQLSARRRELAAVEGENKRLHAELAARSTNAAGAHLVLMSKAQFAGYGTPDDTLQSMLWAVRQHDLNRFQSAFTPDAVQEFEANAKQTWHSITARGGRVPPLQTFVANNWNGFLYSFHDRMAGFIVTGQAQLPDGGIELNIQGLLPDHSLPPMRFKQIDGQWKLQALR